MGKTSEKLAYLNETKRLMRRRINSLGGSITLETKFREYLDWLNGLYKAASAPVDFEILGETKQRAINTSVNLLPLYDDEIVTDGVTVTISDGGKITINGTPTRDLYIKLTNGMEVEYSLPTPNQGHRWYNEKIVEFDTPTTINYQIGIGGGTQATNSNSLYLGFHNTNNSPESSQEASIRQFINGSFQEKQLVSTYVLNNATELNFLFLKLKSGELLNTFGYVQVGLNQESTWTPNNDAIPPSPDNPKEIINKTGDITYEASDGTEFPVSLGAIELCGNPNPDGKPDRIYYERGQFILEKRIGKYIFTGQSGENWTYSDTYDVYSADIDTYFGSPYVMCNYFKNIQNSSIVDYATAGANLNNGEFAVTVNDTFFLKFTDLDEDDPLSPAYRMKEWLGTHTTIFQFELEEEEIEDNIEVITAEDYPTLYAQLQAIIDYETQLQIENKLGG